MSRFSKTNYKQYFDRLLRWASVLFLEDSYCILAIIQMDESTSVDRVYYVGISRDLLIRPSKQIDERSSPGSPELRV